MKEGIFLSQANYAHNLVEKFGLEHRKRPRTPMSRTLKITKYEKKASIDQHDYRSMIGGLLYLTASRQNIAFRVGVCARYQADPKDSQKKVV